MKAFFSNMSLARLIILISIPGSIYLALEGTKKSEELAYLRSVSSVQLPKLLLEIQEISMLNSKLQKDINGDELVDKNSLESYVRYCADHPSVSIGDVRTDPTSRLGQGGVIDKEVKIRPSDPKRAYTHSQIASFFYRLEADSNQVKVTDIRYRLLGKSIKNDDIPDDEWTFEATITNRVKESSGS